VVNGHKSAADIDSPDGGTSKTCVGGENRHRHSNYDVITSSTLGGGMHCPSASSLWSPYGIGRPYIFSSCFFLLLLLLLFFLA